MHPSPCRCILCLVVGLFATLLGCCHVTGPSASSLDGPVGLRVVVGCSVLSMGPTRRHRGLRVATSLGHPHHHWMVRWAYASSSGAPCCPWVLHVVVGGSVLPRHWAIRIIIGWSGGPMRRRRVLRVVHGSYTSSSGAPCCHVTGPSASSLDGPV